MKRMINFVKGKKDDKKDKVINSNICVEITNPLGQKVPSEDEHIIGLQSGYGYEVDLSGRDKSMTKLHKAAWQGNLEKVKLHLKKYDINAIDECNRTPLHLAAAQGHTNVVCFLLNNKAIPDICDNDGMTPFLKAVECGVKECVGVLVEREVNICSTDNNGNTALHITAKQGFFNIMSMLLKNGANCDCANSAGEMALHIATEQEHRDLVEVLLQAGAHVNVVDRENRTPLMLAARVGQSSIVSLLLKHGAHLDACDNNGWTAEDYAVIGGHEQLAMELKVPQSTPALPETDIDEADVPGTSNECINDPLPNISNEPSESEVILQPESEAEANKPSLKSPPYSVLVMEEEAQESPRSCVTPPPLNPPRSWEIIQAGMIDQTQVRRRSLMALGTLESHRESFVENGNGHESLEIPILPAPSNITVEADQAKADSDTEWGSDDSLPLDRSLPPPPEFPDSSLECSLPLPDFMLTPDSSLPHVPELIITPDRRSRITVERTPSLDLTDSEIMDSHKISTDETLGREGTIKGSEETWESNGVLRHNGNVNKIIAGEENDFPPYDTGQIKSEFATKENVNEVQNQIAESTEIKSFDQNQKENKSGGVRESYSLDNLEGCTSKCSEMESSQSCGMLNSERFSGAYSLDPDSTTHEGEFTQSLDSLEEESLVGTVVKRNVFHESHSLELLEEAKKPSRHHHARNKSMSVTSYHWSKSVDVLSKPCKADGPCVDSQRIDAQLQCYDEALRELAEEQMVKQDLLNRVLDFTKSNLNQSVSCDMLESKIIVNQNPSTSSSQSGSMGFKSDHLHGSSFEGSSYSNPPKESFKNFKKFNTIDSSNTKYFYQERAANNKFKGTAAFLPVDNYTIVKQQAQRIDLDQVESIACETLQPSTSQALSCKPKTNKHRSSSTSSKSTKGSFEGKHKFYNSLELPPRYKKGKESKNESNGIMDYKRSLTVSSMPERQSDGKLLIDSVQTNFNKTEIVNKSWQSPKPPPRVKKSLKKEKSEGDMRKKSEEKGATKKRVNRSISLYVEQTKHDDLSKKQFIEGKEPFFNEKSESDSEWSERSVHNKRKQFMAMRGVVADSDDSNEEDPPFWLSTGKDGCFSRQDTVIHNQHVAGVSAVKKDSDEEKSGGEGNEEVTSSSDTGSMSLSRSEASPSHPHVLKSHQSLLKVHLKQATEEKAKLEEVAAHLKEQTERLQYNLSDANQSIIVRDDKILILQDELSRLSSKYSAALDEINSLKQRLTSAEIELKHLREITKINIEKEQSKPDINSQQLMRQLHESNKARKRIEFEKDTLVAQHIMDIKKLQQDTIHWKNLYEDAVLKLEQIEGLCDPCLMENNQHLDKVRSAFKKFRDEKNSGRYKIKTTGATDLSCKEKESSKLKLLPDNIEPKEDICFVDDTTVDNQVATLQLQLQQEKSRSSALENQVQKMLLDLQSKLELEAEFENLNRRLEKEFVPRMELEQLRANQESAIGRIRQQALIESETKINAKLTEINQILQLQLQEQTQKERMREVVESQMKQEFENTRQKLLLELSRVQAALKAKESEERMLREQCEALTREAEKAQELKRRQLIEKSYSVNLVDPTTTREKEMTVKQSVVPPPPPPPPLAPTPLDINLFSANSLRQQLERSISKHRDIHLSLVSEDRLPSPPGRSQQ